MELVMVVVMPVVEIVSAWMVSDRVVSAFV
jgi:hypothetical protein